MTLLFVLVGIAVVAGIGLVSVGRFGSLEDAPPDYAPDSLPDAGLEAEGLETARFDVAFRGYRMDEVDDLLDRVSAELAERDARIAQNEAEIADLRSRATGERGDA